MQYKNVKDLANGRGDFHVLVRADVKAYILAYVGGSVRYPEIVALTDAIPVDASLRQKPRQIRVSLVVDRADQVRVMWNMPKETLRHVHDWGVDYGSREALHSSANVSAVYMFSATNMCDKLFQPAGRVME